MGIGRPGGGITSPFKMIANIFVSFIGAGMLGLPFAFKESGIMEGALIMAVVGYLSVAAMLMLIDCKYAILSSGGRAGGRSIIMDTKVPLIPPESSDDEDDEDERHPPTPSTDLTYGDVGLYALGPGGKRLVDIVIVVSQLGFCCGYLIYLCKNLNIYIPGFSQRFWMLFLLPPLYCLTMLRHLNKLAIFSVFAQVSNVLALAVVFWFDFSHSEEVPFTPKEFSIKGFPFFFAVAIYCYEGAGMILSLEESMAEHKRDKFRSIFVCTMTGLTMLYICFGVSGYASFGPHTMDIITLNLPHGSGTVDFAAMVKICLGISLFFTYPMMMFPVTHLLDKTFSLTTAPYRGNIMRLILVGMTGVVVNAVPNFAILMSLIGATCCTLLAFILPATFHLSIFRQRLPKRQKYFDIMLIVLGVIGSIVGLWDAFNRMNEGHEALLEVNEFSSVKNGSLHTGHASTSAPVNSLEALSTIVLSNISVSEKNLDRLSKAQNIDHEDIQINALQGGIDARYPSVAVPTGMVEVQHPIKSGTSTTKDTPLTSSASGSRIEIDSSTANGLLGTRSKGTESTSVTKSLKDESVDNLRKTMSSQKAEDESSHKKQVALGTQQSTIPKGSKT